jgi:hypothetical protein
MKLEGFHHPSGKRGTCPLEAIFVSKRQQTLPSSTLPAFLTSHLRCLKATSLLVTIGTDLSWVKRVVTIAKNAKSSRSTSLSVSTKRRSRVTPLEGVSLECTRSVGWLLQGRAVQVRIVSQGQVSQISMRIRISMVGSRTHDLLFGLNLDFNAYDITVPQGHQFPPHQQQQLPHGKSCEDSYLDQLEATAYVSGGHESLISNWILLLYQRTRDVRADQRFGSWNRFCGERGQRTSAATKPVAACGPLQ